MSGDRTLILCVDRDDDIGFKAGIQSPVIGREDCLEAATRLGLKDPEDSDVNAIFQGIKIYDDRCMKGDDVCIAVIAGDHHNSIEGDRKIAEDLRKIVWDLEVAECILVTDGAEDEFILPVIQSRVSVSSVQRVIVNQMPNLEGTYYIIKKLLDDPKHAQSILVPVGMVMLTFALGSLFGSTELAVFIVVGVLGVFLLFKGLGIDEYFSLALHGLQESFVGGRVSFVCYITALVIGILGIIMGLSSFVTWYAPDAGVLFYIITFVYGAVSYIVGAILIALLGKIIDVMQNEPKMLPRTVTVPFFVGSLGLIAYGVSLYIISLSTMVDFPIDGVEGIRTMLFTIVGGLVLASVGVYVQKALQKFKKYAPEIKEHTDKRSMKN
jgi:putative membrane protein